MQSPSILGIAGSVRRPSRTAALVGEVLAAIGQRLGIAGRLIELGGQGVVHLDSLARDSLSSGTVAIIDAIEEADILVVGSPVYRASYTGLFKHVFDLVHYDALAGKTVVLTATGGTPLHGLVMEHQLRPLFGFFRAHTVPSTVYATEADFNGYVLASPLVQERIERVADEAVRLSAAGGITLPGPARGPVPLNA